MQLWLLVNLWRPPGGLRWMRSFHFDFKADAIGIDHVDALAVIRPAGEGKLSLTLSGSGSLDHPRIQGDVVLKPLPVL